MAELDLEKLITHFAHSNIAEGKSPKTISWYDDMLSDFIKFLQMREIKTILTEFNVNNIREFVIHNQGKSLSPYTIQGKVRALKVFSSWLFTESYTPDNMLSNVKLPKVPIKLVETLTQDEIETLIGAQNPLTAIGCRNTAILIILLDSGLRCSELSNLLFENSHIDEGYLKVNGKGSKERLVPIGALTQKVLWRYILHFRPQPVSEEGEYLLLTLDGKHLQTNAIKLILKR